MEWRSRELDDSMTRQLTDWTAHHLVNSWTSEITGWTTRGC